MGNKGEPAMATDESASSIRYEVLSLVTLMSVLLYLDRFCISMASTYFQKEFDLSRLEIGLVYSAFFLSYALAQVPTSWLGDRLGARLMLGSCVLAWSLLTGMIGLASGLASLLVIRLLLGISQAGAYPIAGRINSIWVPDRMRAMGNGLVTMGGRGGAALAPFLTAELILLYNNDWRPVFWLYGAAGVVWSAYFFARFRNTPQEDPRCNAAEIAVIEEGRGGRAIGSPPRLPQEQPLWNSAEAGPTDASQEIQGDPYALQGPPEPPRVNAAESAPSEDLRKLPGNPFIQKTPARPWWVSALLSGGLWLQCASQFASNIAWLFLGTWLPTYLGETYSLDLKMQGLLSSLPFLGGMFGCLLGGVAADRLTRTLGLRWGRNLLGIGSKVLAAIFLLLSVFAGDAVLATAALALASFVNDMGLGVTWAYLQDAGGRYVAPLIGFSNMFGNFGAMASPLLLAWLSTSVGWSAALYFCSALFVVSGVCWFGMDGRVPIVPEPAAE